MAFSSNPYYYEVDIDHTKIDASLTDFIFYIGSMPSAFFSRVHSTGKDIRVSNADGTAEFPIHLRHVDTGAETIRLFTRVSSVSLSADTRVRVWCGDHTLSLYAATDTYGRNAVYNTKLAAAFALSESASGTGTSDVYIDMTGNGNDGDDYVAATGKSGVVGDGQEFNGSSDYILFPSSGFQSIASGTIVAWVTPQTVNQAAIFDHSASIGTSNIWSLELANYNLGTFGIRLLCRVGGTTKYNVRGNTVMSTGVTYHISVSVDASGVRSVVNGVAETLTAYEGSSSNSDFWDDLGVSANLTRAGILRYSGSDFRPLDGYMDELWIGLTALSNEYSKALYLNQLDPGSFYSVGVEKANDLFLPKVIFLS